MSINFIYSIIKFIGLNLCITYVFYKIINKQVYIKYFKSILILGLCMLLGSIESIIKINLSAIPIFYFICIFYSIIFGKLTENKLNVSFIVTTLSVAICYIAYFIASVIVDIIIILLLPNYSYTNPINFLFIFTIEFYIIFRLFKIPRFKNGFPFLRAKRENEYFDFFILSISILIIFIYFLMSNYYNFSFINLTILLISFIIIMALAIRKTFIIYQKQKLLEKTIKDYEEELNKTKEDLEKALTEKNNLVKANHEFYNRQSALKLKLDKIMQPHNNNFKEEYGNIINRINTLSEEYSNLTCNNKFANLLPKTNISELDDMFNYMQSECIKNNIEFTLKITSDINFLLNNIIPKNKLETLIGDLIRNSIIAINYSNNKNRAIMAILGIKNNVYEFSVYDTGIEFEIPTLLKLGKEHATTHKDSGGTGIGFITTFETLEYCKSSLIISEFSKNDSLYTKCITMKFDYNSSYIVETYRINDFYKFCKQDDIRNDMILISKL